MAVLSQDWQPTAEALQPAAPDTSELQHCTGSRDNTSPWALNLYSNRCSREFLSLTPKGLHCLYLRSVHRRNYMDLLLASSPPCLHSHDCLSLSSYQAAPFTSTLGFTQL
jgi:hypothetical protein